MSWHRVEQYELMPLPPRMPLYRRRQCLCGCGRWWYQARTKGRPTDYATPDCARLVRNRRRREVNEALLRLDARAQAASLGTEPGHPAAGAPPPDRANTGANALARRGAA